MLEHIENSIKMFPTFFIKNFTASRMTTKWTNYSMKDDASLASEEEALEISLD